MWRTRAGPIRERDEIDDERQRDQNGTAANSVYDP
jgi:hypothetical protein